MSVKTTQRNITMITNSDSFPQNRDIVTAISLHQPWAFLIAMGFKHYETRSWSTNYRGKLVICSAKKNSREQKSIFKYLSSMIDLEAYTWDDLPLGSAVTLCTLTDCIKMTDDFIEEQSEIEQLCGDWTPGRYAWKLEDIKPLSKPVPVKGHQGLWNLSYSAIEDYLRAEDV